MKTNNIQNEERRIQFHPCLRSDNKNSFHLTHFSPVRPIELTMAETRHNIERHVTGSLKFGERLDFKSLLDSRFDAMRERGFGNFRLSQPIALTKLYLEGGGILVELDLKDIMSAKATSVFDKDAGSNPFIHLKTIVGGRFDSSIPAFSTTYWNRHYMPLYELDVTVTFTASEEYGMGTLMAMGAARFAGMKRTGTSGVNIPQQMSDHFFNVRPRAFELEVHVACRAE